ncbi:MAG: bifunctional phosphoribosylaminoimidazolecarboxamide formyltransferase/IMP cyclohydrolase, partial [SAR202 cluster bacterium Io17-Chloro-G9]
MRALISVYDKSGVVEFAKTLAGSGYELISTGGTHQTLSKDGGLDVKQVSVVTGSPEILDGRVKTLHPVIHAGLLARRDSPEHQAELAEHKITPIDLVAVNLYPFVATVSKPNVTLDEALENIDIGGPTMLRAAAKNFPSVAVVVDPADYGWVADRLKGAGLTMEERKGLAAKAFHHVSVYDAAVTGYLNSDASSEGLPDDVAISLTKVTGLRYGENPHQQGALYLSPSLGSQGVAGAKQLHGRELSYNNLMDADAAWRTVSDFDQQTVAVVKHANACGLASHDEQVQAYERAFEGDPVSAFGGIVAYNRTVTAASAKAMGPVFYEVVVAPGYEPEALETLKKKRNLRILEAQPGD